MDDDTIRDMFDSIRPISIRRMFGGKGIYREGVIVALEVDGQILLKADHESAAVFRAAGAVQWVYAKKASPRSVAMPYWSIPDEAVDDPDELRKWVRLAYEAGLRSRTTAKIRPSRRSS